MKFTKFTDSVAISLQMNFLTSKCQYCNTFIKMPALRIKVNRPILPILTLKLVAIATSFEPSEGQQIGNLRSNTYHTVKIWCKSV